MGGGRTEPHGPRGARRKPTLRDFSSEEQQTSVDTQENEEDEQLSARARRGKERCHRAEPRVMSEDEEMKLALRLSEQEAGVSAVRQQQEEEAMRRAIRQSRANLCRSPLSASASIRSSKRRTWSPEEKLSSAAGADEPETRKCVKKRRVREGSPAPDSTQSSDSTHIQDSPPHISPVFPLTGRTAKVHIQRLEPDVLHACSSLGFILCSQESCTSLQTHQHPDGVPEAQRSSVYSRELGSGPESPGSSRPCRDPITFLSSSPESFSPSVRSTSPVFPGSPSHPGPGSGSDGAPGSDRKQNSLLHDLDDSSSPQSEELRDEPERSLLCDMTVVMSDCEDELTLTDSPSPVFPEEAPPPLKHQAAGSPPGTDTSRPSLGVCEGGDTCDAQPSQEKTVCYHWGVPFCPRGLDPDAYTQVIVAQMDFYEKSVKRARRLLLRKAVWGAPILPQKCLSPEQSAESPSAPVSERQTDLREEEQPEEEEQGGGSPALTEDCQTPQSDLEEAQPLSQHQNDHSSQLNGIPQGSRSADDLKQDEEVMEEENEGSSGDLNKPQQGLDPLSVSEDREKGHVTVRKGEELVVSAPHCSEPSVDCPLCQRAFPVKEVERHAAYCDGQEDHAHRHHGDTVSTEPQGTRVRRAVVTASRAHGSRKWEKCYVCQQEVALKDYTRHVELCIQQQSSRTSRDRNLLGALDQMENRSSGENTTNALIMPHTSRTLMPSSTGHASTSAARRPVRDVIDLLTDEEEEVTVLGFTVSDSPIKAFTPISEAPDCLVDFSRQTRTKTSRRRCRR